MTALPEAMFDAGTIVELGIGDRTDLAQELHAQGRTVIATDLRPRSVPDGVHFVEDDVTDPTLDRYRGADLFCARRLPGELQQPAADLADRMDAPLLFTTLGFEFPEIAVETVSHGEPTWYRATKPT